MIIEEIISDQPEQNQRVISNDHSQWQHQSSSIQVNQSCIAEIIELFLFYGT